MNQFQLLSADEIVRLVHSLGKVDSNAVQALEKHLQADWVVTIDEAELLFQIDRQVGRQDDNCPTWRPLFIEAISRFVVFDMNTPGEISTEESEWLRKHLSPDGELTPNEVQLLKHIRKHSASCCESMQHLFSLVQA